MFLIELIVFVRDMSHNGGIKSNNIIKIIPINRKDNTLVDIGKVKTYLPFCI